LHPTSVTTVNDRARQSTSGVAAFMTFEFPNPKMEKMVAGANLRPARQVVGF
jgi:hypothetical protein